jgi:hydrogenase expression/formation protein HypC
MCVGIPMRILSVDGIAARAEDRCEIALIDLSLCDHAGPGDWVLTFLGAAREVISAQDARKIAAALDALRAIMRGEAPGDAFADLDATGPRLPDHLAAALARGETVS